MASSSKRPRSCASPSVVLPLYETADLDDTIEYETAEPLYMAPRSMLIRLADEADHSAKPNAIQLFRAVQNMCIAFAKLGFYSTPNIEVQPGDELDQIVELLRAESLTVAIVDEWILLDMPGEHEWEERHRHYMQVSWEKDESAEN